MSPRQVLPRQSSKNYAPAVRQFLPANQPLISWQAKAVIGCPEWHVVTPQGKLVAIVVDYSHSTLKRLVNTEQTAQLMADAPLLLNELALAHEMIKELINAALSLADSSVKSRWVDEHAYLGIDRKVTTRANERYALLLKHRQLGGVQ